MKRLPYGLGVIIPCSLISVVGWGMFFHILRYQSRYTQTLYTFTYIMIWISYLLAICTDPGFIPIDSGHTPGKDQLDPFTVWCSKCEGPKPERAHHCSQCNRCVLKMDHHCPWTLNCVGHANLPHFVRFLFWVLVGTLASVVLSVQLDLEIWRHPELPAYLFPKQTIVWGIIIVPVAGLVFLTIGLLFARVVANLISGKTQIEDWEIDRQKALARKGLVRRVEFPFDIDPWTNITTSLGPLWIWLVPWSKPIGDGYTSERIVNTKMRWPPETAESRAHAFYNVDNWISPEGESIGDFGVDTTAEENRQPAPSPVTPSVHASTATAQPLHEDDLPLASLRRR